MLIKVDEAGKKVIESLCDVALKTGGIQNLNVINEVMGCIVIEDTGAPKEIPK